MKTEVEFRPVPDFPAYEINRQGTFRRRLRVSPKNTRPIGKAITGRFDGTLHALEQDGRKWQTTKRALLAKVFGPDAVPPWRYHIITHPELKIKLIAKGADSALRSRDCAKTSKG